jgi:hypothetical protein
MPRPTDTRKARGTRRERADILQGLERGTVQIVDLIKDPDPCVQTADLWDVLMRTPGLGRSGIKRVCQQSMVWPHEKIGDLSVFEKRRIIDCLPERMK